MQMILFLKKANLKLIVSTLDINKREYWTNMWEKLNRQIIAKNSAGVKKHIGTLVKQRVLYAKPAGTPQICCKTAKTVKCLHNPNLQIQAHMDLNEKTRLASQPAPSTWWSAAARVTRELSATSLIENYLQLWYNFWSTIMTLLAGWVVWSLCASAKSRLRFELLAFFFCFWATSIRVAPRTGRPSDVHNANVYHLNVDDETCLS